MGMTSTPYPPHPDHGDNPHKTYCFRCGGDSTQVIMGHLFVAHLRSGRSLYYNMDGLNDALRQAKLTIDDVMTTEEVPKGKKVPSGRQCVKCRKQEKANERIVAKGGVYFMCQECNMYGVIGKSLFSADVKKAQGKEKHEPCGVSFKVCDEHISIGLEAKVKPRG